MTITVTHEDGAVNVTITIPTSVPIKTEAFVFALSDLLKSQGLLDQSEELCLVTDLRR